MQKIISLLKENRGNFIRHLQEYPFNIDLCLLTVDDDQVILDSFQQGGWDEKIAYFPKEKFTPLESHTLNDEHTPSYLIAGVTSFGQKLWYFATARVYQPKMITNQKNYDHTYRNEKIHVFEDEESFVKYLVKTPGFVAKDKDIDIDDLYYLMHSLIKHDDPIFNLDTMVARIVDGCLVINPTSSLADQM